MQSNLSGKESTLSSRFERFVGNLEKIKLRRVLLSTALVLALSACGSSTRFEPQKPVTQPTASTKPTPTDVPTKTPGEIANEFAFVILRQNIALSPEGEPAFMIRPKNQEKFEVAALGPRSPFNREVTTQEGIRLTIIKVGVETSNSTNYKLLLEKSLRSTKSVFSRIAKELGLSEPTSVANEITITINDSVIPSRTGDYWPLAENSDQNITNLIQAVQKNQRFTPLFSDAEGNIVRGISLAEGRNLIGINVSGSKDFGNEFRINGIQITGEEAFELTAINEFATFFLEHYQKNKPAEYQKLVVYLKNTYKFPPTENPNYSKQLSERAKLLKRKETDLVNDAIFEALTTIIEYEYLVQVLKK